ncbi:hypothetical protein GPECTOR_12g485 [Gonium pectorale]|uniref:Protein kinase domain-containing protein n=1 Tax=Gonium pectorale TaxID=33097 RepID=A0A150GP58_GONPE|nr:hypothetical protein GPECTOR_12g485 [Gonium pectorale]|eukprot:KXZ51522.1 hypothetical protein GPECTOR_12g485 [Gonium pectorale]
MSEHPPGAAAQPAASQEPTTSYTIDVDLELVPVTPLTPIPAAIDMDVRVGEGAGEGELQLLPITLGKGAFGRVVVGLYGASQEPTTSYTIDVDLELVPVTPLTPIPAAIDMDVRVGEGAGEGELQLLPITLGKGAFGRVVVGLYGGHRVAVKLLNTGLALPLPDAAIWKSEAARTATAARTSPEAAGPGGQQAEHGDGNCVRRSEAATLAAGAEQESDSTVQAAGRAFGGEVAVLARCQHPNIVRLLAASLECVLHIVMQIGRALSYMHPTILHRDLKPANVLVSNADSETPVIKLGDFGLARLRDTILVTREPEVGTVPYISPEAFEPANFIISDRADMYALGVILWELLSGMRPWGSLSHMQIACAVTIKGDRLSLGAIPPERCLPKLATLMKECWDADPLRRPAAAEFVKTIALVQQVCGMPSRGGLLV